MDSMENNYTNFLKDPFKLNTVHFAEYVGICPKEMQDTALTMFESVDTGDSHYETVFTTTSEGKKVMGFILDEVLSLFVFSGFDPQMRFDLGKAFQKYKWESETYKKALDEIERTTTDKNSKKEAAKALKVVQVSKEMDETYGELLKSIVDSGYEKDSSAYKAISQSANTRISYLATGYSPTVFKKEKNTYKTCAKYAQDVSDTDLMVKIIDARKQLIKDIISGKLNYRTHTSYFNKP